ncbi:hypothetical protein [Streptomyces griseofuscus]
MAQFAAQLKEHAAERAAFIGVEAEEADGLFVPVVGETVREAGE